MKCIINKILLPLVFSCAFASGVWSQQRLDVLTLEQVADMALVNNQALQIQRKAVEISTNNVFKGNANMLPTINLIANSEHSNNNTEVGIRTFTDNPAFLELEDDAAATTTHSIVVQADYQLLGGFSARYQYRLLQDQQNISRYQQEVLVNNTILNVSELFLEIAKLQAREELLRENLVIGRDRLARIEDQFQFGKVSGLDVLRAKTDLNQDQTALDNVLLAKNNLKRDMNFLIGLEPETRYRVSVTYQPPILLPLEELKEEVQAHNPELKLNQVGIEAAENELKLNQSGLYPSLNAFANYGYLRQENDVQQVAELENIGYTVGVSFRYNLFNGNRTRNNVQNARINVDASKLRKEQNADQLIAGAIKEQNNLSILQNQLEREQQNLDTFKESFTRTEERYFNGQATSLDLRDAQVALLNAQITISDVKADILRSSLRLESLKGVLLKEK